jgi:UDP-N-acetylmuramoylalanine--D-glutamate ligase
MALTKVEGQTWHVVGAGKSGVAAAELLARHGAKVVLVDEKPIASWGVRPVSPSVRCEQVVLATLDTAAIARCVVSPGVPPGAWSDTLDARRVPVWSEIELAWQLRSSDEPVVAVGGTNGKSTTTSLVAHVLAAAGKRVFAGGNLGEPWANHDAERFDAAVIEVSSFQLERVVDFQPKVSVLLNVTPDHLDRYPSFEHYAAAKGRAFERQVPGDLAVIPAGDDVCRWQAVRGRGAVVTFGVGEAADVSVQGACIEDRARGIVVDLERTRLRGGHNALNVAATLAALRPFGLDSALVVDAIGTFEGLAHRTALVRTVAGVRYYDDSKGTNVGAAVTALVGLLESKAVLVAGGKDKGGSYEPLVAALRTKGRAVVTIGEAAPLIEAALGSAVPWRRASSMAEAVSMARGFAEPGDAVLLSPACASFDMFRDYKHRGDAFVEAVRALEEAPR